LIVIEHDISDFKKIIKHPKSVFSLITSIFILYPIIGILFAYFTLSSPDIYTGIILLCFAPSPFIAALWTEMSGGDGTIPLTTSLFSMLLSIGIYPIVLYFMGLASLNLSVDIFKLLALSIFVPAIIALLLRDKENKYISLKRKFKILSAFVALYIIVIAIANLFSKILPNELNIVFLLTILAITLLIAGFAYVYFLSRLFKVQKKIE
jgi:BASS family bile acid:Na+ symporter